MINEVSGLGVYCLYAIMQYATPLFHPQSWSTTSMGGSCIVFEVEEGAGVAVSVEAKRV